MRGLRLWLSAGGWPAKAGFDGEAQRRSFDQAFWLVRLYYAAMMFIAYQEMAPLWTMASNGGQTTPLWPVFWATNTETASPILIISLISSAFLAIAFPDRRWPKILVFLAFLSTAAFRSSFGLGSINHGHHYWIWIGFCFCFLPTGPQATLRASKMARYHFLLTFFFTQGLILLFYTMSGFWKVAAGIDSLISGEMNTFHPMALATITTWKMIQLDRITLIGPYLADYPLLGWPAYIWVVYIELAALLVLCRPALHRVWGLMLVMFHIGTFMLLGINFPKHVLALTILFVWSPFAIAPISLRQVIRSLPGLAWLDRGSTEKEPADLPSAGEAVLVYDGDCPFCRRYATMIRLRDDYRMTLINARENHPLVEEIRAMEVKLDKGMVLKIHGRYYHGDRCLHILALMGDDQGIFSQVTRFLFGHPALAAIFYPALALGRQLTLSILRRQPLGY